MPAFNVDLHYHIEHIDTVTINADTPEEAYQIALRSQPLEFCHSPYYVALSNNQPKESTNG